MKAQSGTKHIEIDFSSAFLFFVIFVPFCG